MGRIGEERQKQIDLATLKIGDAQLDARRHDLVGANPLKLLCCLPKIVMIQIGKGKYNYRSQLS